MPGLFLIEEEYRLALLETQAVFTARLIERMNDPGTEWMGHWAAFHGENRLPRRRTHTQPQDRTMNPSKTAQLSTPSMTTGSVSPPPTGPRSATSGSARARAVVILHGSNESARSHTPVRAGAGRCPFTVYLPDRRGRGRSGPHRADHSLRTEVEDLQAVLAGAGADKVFSVSIGGLIALEAARAGAAIRQLALYEPAYPHRRG